MANSRGELAVAAVAAAALLLAILLLPAEVFWISDEGTKFIQLQSLVRFGGVDVVYPGRALDPQLRFLPDAGHHLIRIGDRVVSLFQPYFAAVNAVPYRLLGARGIYLLPLLGALVSIWLCGRLGMAAGTNHKAAPLLLLFATPLFFYSVTYWEQSLALALSTGALLLVLRDRPAFAGILLALSTLLREEGYVLTIAVALALLVRTRAIRQPAILLGAWLLIMAPAWIWHFRLYGSIVGVHGSVYASYAGGGFSILAKARSAFDLLLRFRDSAAISIAIVAPQIAAIAFPRLRRAILLGACAAAIASAILLSADADRVFATGSAQGLLPFLPFATLFLLAWRDVIRDERLRFLAVVAALFVAGVCAVVSTEGRWIIWGPRHFFAILPVVIVLSAAGFERLRAADCRFVTTAAAVLVAAAIAIEANGVYTLALKKHASLRMLHALEAERTGVVVTDVFWLPQEMASLFYAKTFLLVRTDADARAAVAALRARGVSRFTFVAARHYRVLSNATLGEFLRITTRRTRVITPGVDFLDVMLLSCEVEPARPGIDLGRQPPGG